MTTPYHLRVAPTAVQHIKALSSKYQKQIVRIANALAINPRPPGAKKIEGMTGLYSEAINHFRLLYKIEDQEIILLAIV